MHRGLTQELIDLLRNMKRSQMPLDILKKLTQPSDRLQLAKDLKVDWKTIDYHTHVLLKHGLIREQVAYGNVKIYELTPVGIKFRDAANELANG